MRPQAGGKDKTAQREFGEYSYLDHQFGTVQSADLDRGNHRIWRCEELISDIACRYEQFDIDRIMHERNDIGHLSCPHAPEQIPDIPPSRVNQQPNTSHVTCNRLAEVVAFKPRSHGLVGLVLRDLRVDEDVSEARIKADGRLLQFRR